MIDRIDYNIKMNDVKESINLLEILRETYFTNLGANIDEKNYTELMQLDKYDYIDYLNEKNKHETLLFIAIDILKKVVE